MTTKQINIVSDTNFNGASIENAVIDTSKNNIKGSGIITNIQLQTETPVQADIYQQGSIYNTTISLSTAYGDIENPYASKTKNYVLAAPNQTNGLPTFRALTKADIPLASETAVNGGTVTSLVTTGEKYTWNNKQNKNLCFTNKDATNWVASSEYSGYGYQCSINCPGVTPEMFALVVFAPTEFDSSSYANICSTTTDSVIIYSEVNNAITIPTIIVMGV